MKLSDARESYYIYSGKTSDIARQLALGGIALVWLFSDTKGESVMVPRPLLWAGLLIVTALALDLLQYVSATAVWGIYQRHKEKRGTDEEKDFKAPRQLNWPTIVFFVAKVPFMVTGYVLIGLYIAKRIGL